MFPGSVEGFTFPKMDVRVLTDEDPYLLLGERLEEGHPGEKLYLLIFAHCGVLLAHLCANPLCFSRKLLSQANKR